jgi:hypothetical protein
MRIRLSGDWAAPLSFTLAGCILFIITLVNPAQAMPGTRLLGVFYLLLALAGSFFAARGREVPDNSTYYVRGDLGMDATAILFSTGLLWFGGLALLSPFTEPFRVGSMLFGCALGIGFLAFAYSFLMSTRLFVFTPDKRMITLLGKPFTFFRRTHEASHFSALEVRMHRAYAGTYGKITTWQRIYDVCAISPTKIIVVGAASDEISARKLLQEIHTLTGIPAHDFPSVSGKDVTQSVSV